MREPREVADHWYVAELPRLHDELEYALVKVFPETVIVRCFRCGKETCDHARAVRTFLRDRGEY